MHFESSRDEDTDDGAGLIVFGLMVILAMYALIGAGLYWLLS